MTDVQMLMREQTMARRTRALNRLVVSLGREEVIRRLRAATVSREDEIRRAWLVLEAHAAEGKPYRQRTRRQ